MKANWRGLSAAVAIAVAAWGLGMAPARAAGEPTTTPTITAPADAAYVAGDVQVWATSTEASVQFYVNGLPFGTQVATSGGVASTTWPTWGITDGSVYAWSAADCNANGCNATTSTFVSVTVVNDAPVISSPLDGTTTGPLPTLSATATGGALSFALDGNPLGVDLVAPYTEPVGAPLADGAHALVVQECDATGAVCSGPTATSNFTVETPVLSPTITAVAPNPFSPHVDARYDTTSFRVHLPDPESVSWSIRNGLNQLVQGPHTAGLLAAGDHVFKWNGRTQSGQVVGDGTYTIAVATSTVSGGLTLRGSTSASVRVDDTPSVLHGAGGNGATFYPVVDGYLDTFGPKVTVNEGGTLWLQIFTSTNALVAQIAQTHAGSGTFQINWNGRNRLNALAAQATFRFRFLAQDIAGNRSTTPVGTVNLSHRHLITKVVTITHPGNPANLGTSDPNCTGYSYTVTQFAHGVVLGNFCDPNTDGAQVVLADYVFAVPAAIRYNTVRLQTLGRTDTAPEVLVGLIYNWSLQKAAIVGTSTVGRNNVNLTSIYGTVPAASTVNASRHVEVAVALGDAPGGLIYDLGTVSIVLSYEVLN